MTVAKAVLQPVGQRLQRTTGGVAGLMVGEILLGNPLYGDLSGIQVLEVPPRSPAYRTGFEIGDVIVSIDGANVRTLVDLNQRIARADLQYRVDLIRDGVPFWMRISR